MEGSQTEHVRRSSCLGWTAVLLLCTGLLDSRLLSAQGESPAEWTTEDSAQFARALAAMNQPHNHEEPIETRLPLRKKEYAEAVRLLLPLYGKAPHHGERVPVSAIVGPGTHLPPDFAAIEWWVDRALCRALEGAGEYSKSLAVWAAIRCHAKFEVLGQDSSGIEFYASLMRQQADVEFPVSVTVNDLWVELEGAASINEGRVLVPLAQLAPALGFELRGNGPKEAVELVRREPPDHAVFRAGEPTAERQGKHIPLQQTPFLRDGRLMVAGDDVARVLDGEAHWYPEVRFMHLIVPAPKAATTPPPGAEPKQ